MAQNIFLEDSAVVQFEKQIILRWVLVGVLLIGAFLGLRWAAISEAQAQAQDRDRVRSLRSSRLCGHFERFPVGQIVAWHCDVLELV